MRDETGAPSERGSVSDLKPSDDSVLSASGIYSHVYPHLEITRTASPGPNDWHPNIDSTLLQAHKRQDSSAAVSSLNEDHGDGQQLADNAEERDGELFAPSQPKAELFGAGSQFSLDETQRKSSISELSDEFLSQNEDDPPPTSIIKSLQGAISKARIESLDKDNQFLPIDSLSNLITEESIQEALRQSKLKGDVDLVSTAKDVLRVKPETKGADRTTRRKIFAILAMMDKPQAILDFIHEQVYDDDLPFLFGNVTADVFSKERDGVRARPIKLFRNWKIHKREAFDSYQWQMTAPYFRLSWKPKKKVNHYVLEARTVLPFIEETPKDGSSSQHSVDFSGGTSTVRKLKIHRAHHDYERKDLKPANPYFAVKTLRLREELAKEKGKDLNREALAFKRFVDKDHEHLIRLLATFSYRNQFHFIFPCADGNLKDLWKKHYPNLSELTRDHKLARWLVGQLHGLACAVQSIHKAPVDGTNSSDLPKAFRDKEHGRHGDLKPENILWFRNPGYQDDQNFMGVLKISDFGFADFHRTNSVKIISLSSIGGVTPTYRAPEYDIAPNVPRQGLVSPAYDIWSFGCVFLEFITWYLLGWDGVDKFSALRSEESESIVPEDNFFNSRDKGHIAASKKSVAKNIRDLKEHENCSDCLLDLLEFIHKSMLRMKPKSRATCDEIVNHLERIMKDCDQSTYCTHRIKDIQPTSTDLSEVVVHYSFPQPGQPDDPINVVNATDVDYNTHRRESRASVVYTADRPSTLAEGERTPLLAASMLTTRSRAEPISSSRLGPMDWARGVVRACCCPAADDM